MGKEDSDIRDGARSPPDGYGSGPANGPADAAARGRGLGLRGPLIHRDTAGRPARCGRSGRRGAAGHRRCRVPSIRGVRVVRGGRSDRRPP